MSIEEAIEQVKEIAIKQREKEDACNHEYGDTIIEWEEYDERTMNPHYIKTCIKCGKQIDTYLHPDADPYTTLTEKWFNNHKHYKVDIYV